MNQLALGLALDQAQTRPSFVTYRNGGGELRERIRAAVTHFYQHQGKMPKGVTVHTSELAKARQIVTALGLRLDVRASGGCILPEVWLEVPQGDEP